MNEQNKPDTRSVLAKARGLGAVDGGFDHWFRQRLTALAMVILVPWFALAVIPVIWSADMWYVIYWLQLWHNAFLLCTFAILALWHAKLGLQVIIEDYIHHTVWRVSLVIALVFAWLGLSALTVILIYAT